MFILQPFVFSSSFYGMLNQTNKCTVLMSQFIVTAVRVQFDITIYLPQIITLLRLYKFKWKFTCFKLNFNGLKDYFFIVTESNRIFQQQKKWHFKSITVLFMPHSYYKQKSVRCQIKCLTFMQFNGSCHDNTNLPKRILLLIFYVLIFIILIIIDLA